MAISTDSDVQRPRSFSRTLRHASLAACVCFICVALVVIISPSPDQADPEFVPADTALTTSADTAPTTAVDPRKQAELDIMSLKDAVRIGIEPESSRQPRPPVTEKEKELAQIPKYKPEVDLIFFSHIHKTSGTSLSMLLDKLFSANVTVPTSHAWKGLQKQELVGHDAGWWDPYQVMYSHDRPNVTDEIGMPSTKQPRLLLVVRNPLLHKASIYFESVCRYGLHIKDGVIDQEEATQARVGNRNGGKIFSFCRDPNMWVGSPQFTAIYRNFQSLWLSYGGAERHPCIKPDLQKSHWDTKANSTEGSCKELKEEGLDQQIWEDFYERSADAAIRRLEGALWVGVTERMVEASCLLLLTLGKTFQPVPKYRFKQPRPFTVWNETSIEKEARLEQPDWRVFEAANDILDLRLWAARERLMGAETEYRDLLGPCYDVLAGTGNVSAASVTSDHAPFRGLRAP